jgi:hypothetical protein
MHWQAIWEIKSDGLSIPQKAKNAELVDNATIAGQKQKLLRGGKR